jgi:hypothetical protein
VGIQVGGDEGIDDRTAAGVEGALGHEQVGDGVGFVEGPGAERGDRLRLVDQPVLERDQAEEEVMVGVGGGHHGGPGVQPFIGLT